MYHDVPAQIETYSCKENEVNLHPCLYDLTTGELKGLQTELAFIMLRGDNNQSFFSYGFDLDKSSVSYSTSKQKIPDAFKHFENIILKLLMRKQKKRSFPLYFRSAIDHRQKKKTINLHKNNVNLTPVDCPLMFIESFASKKGTPFNTQILNSTNPEHRNPRVKCCMGCLDKLLNTAIITWCVMRIIFQPKIKEELRICPGLALIRKDLTRQCLVDILTLTLDYDINNTRNCSLLLLCNEIWKIIIDFLHVNDLANLRRVCKHLREIILLNEKMRS